MALRPVRLAGRCLEKSDQSEGTRTATNRHAPLVCAAQPGGWPTHTRGERHGTRADDASGAVEFYE